MNDASELTTRDVLQQIDRRLSAVEEGLRARGAELRAEIAALRAELRTELQAQTGALRAEIGTLRSEIRSESGSLRSELHSQTGSLRADMTSGFRWLVGLILVSWLSMMGMMLPLLLRQ